MKIADISHYQGTIDWLKANQELELAIFRSSVGSSLDTKYTYNTQNCIKPYGAYHYFKAGNADEAKTEAAFFYKVASAANPLFYVFDIEYSKQNSKTTKPVCQAALETLRNLTNKKVGLYIGQSRYPYIKDIRDKFDFIWIPRYGKNTGEADPKYAPKYPCDMWQFTSNGHVEGIKGRVDLNKLCGEKKLDFFTAKPVSTPTTFKTLKKKMEGQAVKELQQNLNKIMNLNLKVDGKFGDKTEAAVKKFQKKYGLRADGLFGKQSNAKMTELLKKLS